METEITVKFYRETGKWYSAYQFNVDIPCYENDKIIAAIKVKHGEAKHMSFTFKAQQGEAINRRLVII